jgi:hypothetical protein
MTSIFGPIVLILPPLQDAVDRLLPPDGRAFTQENFRGGVCH